MKKSFKLFAAALMALGMFVPAQAAELTLFDGTATSRTAPINVYWFDDAGTQTQVIYPEDELAPLKGRPINSMKFYFDGVTTCSDEAIRISLGTYEYDAFQSNEFLTDLTPVATISMEAGITELLITFDEPFVYEGGNLVFESYVEVAGTYSSYDYFVGVNPYRDNVKSRSQLERFIPKTTFDFTPADYAAAVTPVELTFKPVRVGNESEEMTVELTNIGLNAFTPAISIAAPFSTTAQPVELASDETLEIPVKFVPTEEGDFTGVMTIDCGEAGVLEVPLNAKGLVPADEITVCDSSVVNKYLPIYGYYYDGAGTYGQMIYPAEKLTEIKGKEIIGITFHPQTTVLIYNGSLQLSLGGTEMTYYESVEPITDLTVVGSVVPEADATELAIYFDEPYKYNGGNLVMEAYTAEPGAWKSTSFFGVETGGASSIYCGVSSWSNAEDTSNFLPKVTFICKKGGEEPVVIRGDVDGSGEVTIADVTALIDILLGEEEAPAAADCNGDNSVTIADVTALIDYLLNGEWND